MTEEQRIILYVILGAVAIIMMVTGLAKSRAIKEAENNWKSDPLPESKPKTEQPQTNSMNTQLSDKKCIFCGAGMSKDQQFCGSCGRRAD